MDETTLYAIASLVVCTITAVALFVFAQKFRLWEIMMAMNKVRWEKRLRNNPERWAYYPRLTGSFPSLHYDSNSRLLRGMHKGCMYLIEGATLFMGIMFFFGHFVIRDAPGSRGDEMPWFLFAISIGWSIFVFGYVFWILRFRKKHASRWEDRDALDA
ncbi:MAG: hypothetical protein JW854_06320 [Actinobacteria bacterium]|nr:hypothetical protein [Actinomycetota bacterium]